MNLAGATIRVGGEPVTAAKVAPMRRVGARVLPVYGAIETGAIGIGCTRPSEIDHVHLPSDSLALIAQPHVIPGTGETVQAFNLTSLVDASPKVMLNYQIDDHGVIEKRNCGCPLHEFGYRTSMHTIRSYSKLLSEGVTVFGSEVQRVIEDVLPARFGGSPLDYQLVEDEDARGFTRLYLAISPRVAIADEETVGRVLLEAIRASSPRSDAAGTVWERAGTLQVLRHEPSATSRGKVLPLHRRRSSSPR
jgi:phenylacetate-coenzyme A ligase PaaK-like adenylate-forming protein